MLQGYALLRVKGCSLCSLKVRRFDWSKQPLNLRLRSNNLRVALATNLKSAEHSTFKLPSVNH